MLFSPAVELKWTCELGCMCALELHVCSQRTLGRSRFKMLYADRESSHNMNHLVTTAELQMSHLISVPHAWVPQRRWRQS